MSTQEIKKEILKYLFEGYKQSPTSIYDITEIAQQYNQNPHELGKYLLERGYVKNQQFRPTGFVCQITVDGINIADGTYMNGKLNQIISTLGLTGGQYGVMEVLDFEPKNFQAAFDIVKHMEMTGLIKEGIYQSHDIIIELSLQGIEFYENNKPSFI